MSCINGRARSILSVSHKKGSDREMMKKMKAKLFVWILLTHLIAGAVAALVIGCAHKKKKKCLLGNVKEKAERAFQEIEDKLEC